MSCKGAGLLGACVHHEASADVTLYNWLAFVLAVWLCEVVRTFVHNIVPTVEVCMCLFLAATYVSMCGGESSSSVKEEKSRVNR